MQVAPCLVRGCCTHRTKNSASDRPNELRVRRLLVCLAMGRGDEISFIFLLVRPVLCACDCIDDAKHDRTVWLFVRSTTVAAHVFATHARRKCWNKNNLSAASLSVGHNLTPTGFVECLLHACTGFVRLVILVQARFADGSSHGVRCVFRRTCGVQSKC